MIAESASVALEWAVDISLTSAKPCVHDILRVEYVMERSRGFE
jgi:hypothetical protein